MNLIGLVSTVAVGTTGIVGGAEIVESRQVEKEVDETRELMKVFKENDVKLEDLVLLDAEGVQAKYLELSGKEITEEQANTILEEANIRIENKQYHDLLKEYHETTGEKLDIKNLSEEEIKEAFLNELGKELTDEEASKLKELKPRVHRKMFRSKEDKKTEYILDMNY